MCKKMDFVRAGRLPSKNQLFWRWWGRETKRGCSKVLANCALSLFQLVKRGFFLTWWNEKPQEVGWGWDASVINSICIFGPAQRLTSSSKEAWASRKDLSSVCEKQEFGGHSDISSHADTANSCGSQPVASQEWQGAQDRRAGSRD